LYTSRVLWAEGIELRPYRLRNLGDRRHFHINFCLIRLIRLEMKLLIIRCFLQFLVSVET